VTVVHYRFPHRVDLSPGVDAFVRDTLHRAGLPDRARLEARLAIYELCRNILEHGRPLVEGAEVSLELTVDDEAIRGWIQDECAYFDLGNHASRDVTSLVRARADRGYGLTLVRQILTVCRHDHNGHGNRISFRILLDPLLSEREQP